MKYLIASDIHGSAFYCRKLLEAFQKEKADKLLLLGDILYHGPRNDLPEEYDTKAVAAMLNEQKDKIISVQGNCDAEVDQWVLDFPILAESLLLQEGNVSIFATHGHKWNAENIPPMAQNSILLHGHTHVPKCVEYDGFVYLNPGSVSIPKEDSPHGYMTLEKGKFLWKDLDGKEYMSYHV